MVWGGIFLLSFALSYCEGEYTLLYGNILAQTVEGASTSDEDVEQAVKLAVGHAKLAGVKYNVLNIVKKRLYFTEDGIAPFKYKTRTYFNDAVRFIDRKIVMGILYTFSIQTTPPSGLLEHQFAVSRDRNRENHIFKHTLVDATSDHRLVHSECSSDADKCSARVLDDLPTLQSFGAANSSNQALRVASYNIWNVNGVEEEGEKDREKYKKKDDREEKYETRLKRLKKLISSLNVDIFGFQEVRLEVSTIPAQAADTRCQACDFAKLLPGYQFVYQPAMCYMEYLMERKEEGLAIFSRYPVLSTDYKLLYRNDSDSEDTHQRICLHAEVYVPQLGPVHVFVSHLSLSESVQEISAVEIWEYMQTYTGPKLLLGDMNAEPNSNTIRFLTGELSIGGVRTSELRDTWTLPVANLHRPGLTFSALEEEPVKRIDYIFASLPHPSKVHITKSEVVMDSDICFLPCSDHHIVSTILNLTASGV